MRRFFTLLLGALAMLAVALISAFIAMRLAIHGREAVVPSLTGMSISEASDTAARQGLQLTLENRFYSTAVGAGRVLAQDPPAGSRVRREWAIRVTESLGPQQVTIPDLYGQSEREATVNIRRLGLEPGVVAHFGIPGDADVVLAQTPLANSEGADSPRVSLLVSDPADMMPTAYVMPSLLGLSFFVANLRAESMGVHLEAAAASAAVTPRGDGSNVSAPSEVSQPPEPPMGIVIAQTPQPGARVLQGNVARIALSGPEPSIPASANP